MNKQLTGKRVYPPEGYYEVFRSDFSGRTALVENDKLVSEDRFVAAGKIRQMIVQNPQKLLGHRLGA